MTDPAGARDQIREFLVSRRARLTPGDVGIPVHEGRRRRVAGLRREEVALLAGVSAEYYVRFERGDATGASPSVVDAVMRVLRMTDVEREHLRQLLLTAETIRVPRTRVTRSVRPELQRLINAMADVPAIVSNRHGDIVATNTLGRALYAPMFDAEGSANTAHFFFLREADARAFWEDWEGIADDAVAIWRAEVGAHPHDAHLLALIDALIAGSDGFRTRWSRHDVHRHRTGMKVMNHPVVGRLELPFENLALPADPDLALMTYNPAPGTAAHDGLRLLGLAAREVPSGTVDER